MTRLTVVALALFAAACFAPSFAEAGKGAKKSAPEQIELKDVPAAVIDAAKKELPAAEFTSAAKSSAKKEGTVYTLEGTQGKYSFAITLNSTGQMLRLTKRVSKQKAAA